LDDFQVADDTAKASLAETQAVASEAVDAKAPEAFFALQSRQVKASTEKAQAYWRHVSEIVSDARGEILAASEKQVAEYVRESQTLVDNLAKNAPASTEAFVSLWKTGFGAAFENAQAAAKQAVEVIDKAGKTVATVKA
jgi:phasin family protein